MLSRVVVSQVKHNSYFLVGLVLGLWLALACVPLGEEAAVECAGGNSAVADADDFAPAHEERRAAAGAGGRSPQRPRYYTTELGMRAPLLAAVLSSQDALESRGAALNATAGARLGGALRFFMSAQAPAPASAPAPARPNVVGFTDTREMLKPFHALKYLADNYLDEYDFFFLVSDASFVNARRLTELVAGLSRSQHVYMGAVADDDSHYCTLEGGILLSNSVLRAVHGSLDWCVRNSYSGQHHENVGRCVLHAARAACAPGRYAAVRDGGGAPPAGLAAAVTAHPVTEPHRFHELHAYVSRIYLERVSCSIAWSRRRMRAAARRHPPGARMRTWPRGLRDEPGLAPNKPENRFDHLRWTAFNASHALLPTDHREVAPFLPNTAKAIQMVVEAGKAYALHRWGASEVELVEGAWQWEPARALRYRLLLRARGGGGARLRQLEIARGIGSARLVPVPYVTESARVWVLLQAAGGGGAGGEGAAFLRRYEAACLQRRANTALIVVLIRSGNDSDSEGLALQESVRAMRDRHSGARVETVWAGEGEGAAGGEGRAALEAARGALPRDALVLLAQPHMDFNDDFLNRVRMNTIPGVQWYLPGGFARYAVYAHARFVDSTGKKPTVHTGRFSRAVGGICAFYRQDADAAVGGAPRAWSVALALSRRGPRALRAPEPALLLPPRAPPCRPAPPRPPQPADSCLRGLHLAELDLGARHTLAKLLLEEKPDLV